MIIEKQLYSLGYIKDIITHGDIQNYRHQNFAQRPYYVSWENDALVVRGDEKLGIFSFKNIKEFTLWHNSYNVQ